MPTLDSITEILKRLSKAYRGLECTLEHKNAMQLLVATILSAQCTDVRVNLVTKELFKKYKTPADFAKANPKTFEQEIRSTGFYHNKARNIIAAAKMIVADFGGKVPDTMDQITKLPGVARKTANVVLAVAFGKHFGIAVDTHVRRLSFRLGLTKHTDPEKIEQDLMQIVPKQNWWNVSNLLIWHGRKVCFARKPDCQGCQLNDICPSAFKV